MFFLFLIFLCICFETRVTFFAVNKTIYFTIINDKTYENDELYSLCVNMF
jgi:hypothetical protein